MVLFGGVLDPYPKGWNNPVVLRASLPLPLLGAWSVPIEQNIAGAHGGSLAFTYTRGAGGGAFDFQIQVSIYAVITNVPAGASEWISMALYDSGALAPGADVGSNIQREFITYGSTGAGAEAFIYAVALPYPVERIRVPARESGVLAPPGTLQVTAEFW